MLSALLRLLLLRRGREAERLRQEVGVRLEKSIFGHGKRGTRDSRNFRTNHSHLLAEELGCGEAGAEQVGVRQGRLQLR